MGAFSIHWELLWISGDACGLPQDYVKYTCCLASTLHEHAGFGRDIRLTLFEGGARGKWPSRSLKGIAVQMRGGYGVRDPVRLRRGGLLVNIFQCAIYASGG